MGYAAEPPGVLRHGTHHHAILAPPSLTSAQNGGSMQNGFGFGFGRSATAAWDSESHHRRASSPLLSSRNSSSPPLSPSLMSSPTSSSSASLLFASPLAAAIFCCFCRLCTTRMLMPTVCAVAVLASLFLGHLPAWRLHGAVRLSSRVAEAERPVSLSERHARQEQRHGSSLDIVSGLDLRRFQEGFLVTKISTQQQQQQHQHQYHEEEEEDDEEEQSLQQQQQKQQKPLLLVVTATFPRPFQAMYLTRLSNTLRSVSQPLLWIVVETPNRTEETTQILSRTAASCLPRGRPTCRRLQYVHLDTGAMDKMNVTRGALQRSRALEYIEEKRLEGIVYVADDDNAYTPQAFEEIRKIRRRVGVMPVGLLYDTEFPQFTAERKEWPMVERALVRPREDGGSRRGGRRRRRGRRGESEVYGWETFEAFISGAQAENGSRIFNIDMAGFAFRSNLLWKKADKRGHPRRPVRFRNTRKGFLENDFLRQMISRPSDMDVLARNNTEVLVWHVHAEFWKGEPSQWYPHFPGLPPWVLPQPPHEPAALQGDGPSWGSAFRCRRRRFIKRRKTSLSSIQPPGLQQGVAVSAR